MMKYNILKMVVVIVFLINLVACGDECNQNLEQAEKELIELYKENDYYKHEFGSALKKIILSDTSTISYPFQQLVDSGYLDIVKSNDGNFRIYEWCTRYSRISDYDNVFQYRANGQVYSFENTPWNYDENNNPIESIEGCIYSSNFNKIHMIDIGEKTYYLVETWARYDSAHGVGGISAFTIEDTKLKADNIFKVGNSTLASIDIEYCFRDWYFVANNDECYDWLFSYDENTKTLYVPLINDEISYGYVTDQYLLYQLKNNYMQYIGRDGGFWLHPSIRNFYYLVGIYETEKFKIRIDNLGNDNLRYVSWSKDKTMADKPDLIIEKGTRMDDWRQTPNPSYEYIFENQEYIYRMYFGEDGEQYLHVEKNGKDILIERIK